MIVQVLIAAGTNIVLTMKELIQQNMLRDYSDLEYVHVWSLIQLCFVG